MKNNGFTLVELLATIVILSMLIFIATPNVLGIINSSKQGISSIAETNLSDAAVTYAKEKDLKLKKCDVNWTPSGITDTDLSGAVSGCYQLIDVSDIVSAGYLDDKTSSCSGKVLVYRYTYKNKAETETFDEIKSYVVPGTCLNY